MIRLDHDGHEIDRDPEPVERPTMTGIRYERKPDNGLGYWERLKRDLQESSKRRGYR